MRFGPKQFVFLEIWPLETSQVASMASEDLVPFAFLCSNVQVEFVGIKIAVVEKINTMEKCQHAHQSLIKFAKVCFFGMWLLSFSEILNCLLGKGSPSNQTIEGLGRRLKDI